MNGDWIPRHGLEQDPYTGAYYDPFTPEGREIERKIRERADAEYEAEANRPIRRLRVSTTPLKDTGKPTPIPEDILLRIQGKLPPIN